MDTEGNKLGETMVNRNILLLSPDHTSHDIDRVNRTDSIDIRNNKL